MSKNTAIGIITQARIAVDAVNYPAPLPTSSKQTMKFIHTEQEIDMTLDLIYIELPYLTIVFSQKDHPCGLPYEIKNNTNCIKSFAHKIKKIKN